MVAGCDLGGSGADPTGDVGFVQNLLGKNTEALHLFLVDQHLFLPALDPERIYNNIAVLVVDTCHWNILTLLQAVMAIIKISSLDLRK